MKNYTKVYNNTFVYTTCLNSTKTLNYNQLVQTKTRPNNLTQLYTTFTNLFTKYHTVFFSGLCTILHNFTQLHKTLQKKHIYITFNTKAAHTKLLHNFTQPYTTWHNFTQHFTTLYTTLQTLQKHIYTTLFDFFWKQNFTISNTQAYNTL